MITITKKKNCCHIDNPSNPWERKSLTTISESVHGIKFLRIMRIIIINVVCKGIGCISIVCTNIWSTFTKHQY